MPRGLESLLVAAAFYPMSLSSICLDSTKFIFEKKKAKKSWSCGQRFIIPPIQQIEARRLQVQGSRPA